MAEGDGTLYKNWKLGVMQAEMDMSSSMAVILVTGYAPSQSDDFYDDSFCAYYSCSFDA